MLLTAILSVTLAQIPADELPVPNLRPGQELVSQGEYHIVSELPGHRFDVGYDIEQHLFVLNTDEQGVDLALVTLTRAQATGQGGHQAVALALGRFSPQTGVKLYPATPSWQSDPESAVEPLPRLPLSGPPRLVNGLLYIVSAAAWEAGMFEPVKGTRSRRLHSRTQSPEWDSPDAKQIGWMAEDTVWLSPLHGYAIRSHRSIHLRDPSERIKVTHVDLDLSYVRRVQHPGSFAERIRDQLIQASQFSAEYRGLVSRLAEQGAKAQLGKLRGRIEQQLKDTTDRTCRAVLDSLAAKVVAAEKGDIAPSDQ